MWNNFQERRQVEGHVKKEGRLPPGQSLTLKFPVLHYGPVPIYPNLDNWTFRIYGLVEEEHTWNWEQFNQLPRRKVRLDLHCVTRWSKFDMEWEGVHLQDLITAGLLKLKPEAKFCIQHCEYGYTTTRASMPCWVTTSYWVCTTTAIRSNRSRLSPARLDGRGSWQKSRRRPLFVEGR